MTDWAELTERTLAELKEAPEKYRPTNFWGPGLDQLLSDMSDGGLENFKSWPTSSRWFYPIYGLGHTNTHLNELADLSHSQVGHRNDGLIHGGVSGRYLAQRDFDLARAMWDHQRWPFRLNRFGESMVGNPPEKFYAAPARPKLHFGRAYLNYLLMLTALSRHVEETPSSFLEIGGGFGVLGEILLRRDQSYRYVNLDIPPLLTVSSYYLSEVLGADRVATYTGAHAQDGPITLGTSGVLPNYRIEDLKDDFEVFVNCFSFQEMEPDVVEGYVDQVCQRGITYAVSLNSRHGKPKAQQAGEWGALDPVKSADITRYFVDRGFRVVKRYNDPLVRSAGELVVLKRRAPAAPVSNASLWLRGRRKLARAIAP